MIRRHLGPVIVEPGRHSYSQAELAEAMRARLSAVAGAEKIRQMVGFVYEHAAIDRRHLEFDLETLAARGDWYLMVNEATLSLARRVLEGLIAEQGPAERFDALITVSSSYAGFPALSRRLQGGLGFRLDANCYDLTGLGCAGPTHGLQLADMLVQTGAARQVCLVCVDALGTHGESRSHAEPPTLSQVVAHCLASDGAAAVALSAEAPAGPPHLSWARCALHSKLWPDSLAENDFTTSADNQPLISVGKEIRTRIVDELLPLIAELEPDTALFHPGGASLMRNLGQAEPALKPSLEISSAVLREHGNIGAGSVLWVLHDAWAKGRPLAPQLRLIALGPGIVSTMLSLDEVESSP